MQIYVIYICIYFQLCDTLFSTRNNLSNLNSFPFSFFKKNIYIHRCQTKKFITLKIVEVIDIYLHTCISILSIIMILKSEIIRKYY